MFRKNTNNASNFGRKISAPIRRFGMKISHPRINPYGSSNSDKPPQPKLEKR